MRVALPATGVGIALAAATGASWTLPLLVANSVVGAVYMRREGRALARIGTVHLGVRIRPSLRVQRYVDLVFHLLLPLVLVRTRIRWTGFRWPPVLGLAVVGLLGFDLARVYPTERSPLWVYVAAHLAVMTGVSVALGAIPVARQDTGL